MLRRVGLWLLFEELYDSRVFMGIILSAIVIVFAIWIIDSESVDFALRRRLGRARLIGIRFSSVAGARPTSPL